MDITQCWSDRGGVANPGDPVRLQGIECIIGVILNLAVRFAGIAVFAMFLIGGFKYLTSGGDPKKTESAQKTITSAILGLAILLGAWLIMRFLEEVLGVPLTEFKLFD